VALRTGPNEDAVNDLFCAFYRHGLRDAEVGKVDAPAVVDALQWEALLRRHHLLAPECEAPKGIDSDGVNDLFKQRRIAWAPINQEDSLWLHGGARRDAEPGVTRPQELSWATMPSGASLELAGGRPARAGRSYSLTEYHLWAIPVHSPSPQLAWEVARFVTQAGLQQRETEAEGLLPIRRDLRAEYPILFRLDWMQHILDASYRQLDVGAGDLPDDATAKGYDDLYTRLRADVVYGRPLDAPVTPDAIRAAVAGVSHAK
jgi:hypothetical protein